MNLKNLLATRRLHKVARMRATEQQRYFKGSVLGCIDSKILNSIMNRKRARRNVFVRACHFLDSFSFSREIEAGATAHRGPPPPSRGARRAPPRAPPRRPPSPPSPPRPRPSPAP